MLSSGFWASIVSSKFSAAISWGMLCVCSRRYPAHNAHAPCYVVICCLSGSRIISLSHKGLIFLGGWVTEHKICFDFIHKFCLEHFSFPEELSEMRSKMFTGSRVKYPLVFSDSNETWILWTHFYKNIQISNFIKICPVGAGVFNVDRQMDRPYKANICFLWLCEQLEKKQVLLQYRIWLTANYSDRTFTEW